MKTLGCLVWGGVCQASKHTIYVRLKFIKVLVPVSLFDSSLNDLVVGEGEEREENEQLCICSHGS